MTRPASRRLLATLTFALAAAAFLEAWSQPTWARRAMVVSQNELASRVGVDVMKEGGNAIDAAVATAGNIGGGGFIVYRPATSEPQAYDFRETAPGRASPTMFMRGGTYDFETIDGI